MALLQIYWFILWIDKKVVDYDNEPVVLRRISPPLFDVLSVFLYFIWFVPWKWYYQGRLVCVSLYPPVWFSVSISIFPCMMCCSTGILGEKQQQEIQHDFTSLFYIYILAFIYGFLLLMAILLITDQGNFSAVQHQLMEICSTRSSLI